MLRVCFLAVVLALGTASAPSAAAEPPVILSTTTSTQDSGLLDVLVPAFEKKSGYTVKTIAVGSGAALAMGERGDSDVILAHAPAAEEAYMAKGRGTSRSAVMHNAFLVVGPAADPAGVKEVHTAREAFARIARAGSRFISRGDDSGTDKKEHALWAAAHVEPKGEWYVKSGSGMGDTLRIASQRAAYTLSDDGTYLALRNTLSLQPLLENVTELHNPYHVIVVKPIAGRIGNPAGGAAFAAFVISREGQRIIATFGREKFGRPLFTPDAGK